MHLKIKKYHIFSLKHSTYKKCHMTQSCALAKSIGRFGVVDEIYKHLPTFPTFCNMSLPFPTKMMLVVLTQ